MHQHELNESDRLGYVVIPGMLNDTQVDALSRAVDRLEEHAAAHVDLPPRKKSAWGADFAEIRIPYKVNVSAHHGGNRGEDQTYRYSFMAGRIDGMMVRMIYFIHDNDHEGGACSVTPGTHTSNLPPPYGTDPDTEPGTISLELKAGDAIPFTETTQARLPPAQRQLLQAWPERP